MKKIIIILWIIMISTIIILKLLHIQNIYMGSCYIKEKTGLSCIACGNTRAVNNILQLEFFEAFKYNPFFVSMIFIIAIFFIILTINIFTNKQMFVNFSDKQMVTITIVFACILILFTILRNTSFYLRYFYV